MTRGLFAGGTDYSHQSFEDMIQDLHNWIKALKETVQLLKQHEDEFKKNKYWDEISFNFQAVLVRSIRFYETSIKELTEIVDELNSVVREDHVKRIRHLGKTASDFNIEYGDAWHKAGYNAYSNPYT